MSRAHACCRSREFSGIVQAARHLRSAAHLVNAVRARQRRPLDEAQFEQLLAVFGMNWGSLPWGPRHRAEALVREPGGLDDLWVCGIPPDQVERFAAVRWPWGGSRAAAGWLLPRPGVPVGGV